MLNKPLKAKGTDGRIYSLVSGETFATYFTPDFAAAEAFAGTRRSHDDGDAQPAASSHLSFLAWHG